MKTFGKFAILCAVAMLTAAVGCNDSKPAPAHTPSPAAGTPSGDSTADNDTGPAVRTVVPQPVSEIDVAEESAAGGKVRLGSPELTAGIAGEGKLKIEEIKAWLDDPANHKPLEIELPLGLAAGAGQVQGLDTNPLTRAKIELGRQLYFDTRLSADNTVSCASCHAPQEGFAKHTQFGVGVKDQQGGRNSPVSYNRILSTLQFWDGRADSLEAQAVGPIQNPIEMGNTHEACVECLKGVAGYTAQFDKIFGGITIDNVGKAIASFERAIVTGPSAFDYFSEVERLEKAGDAIEDDPELAARLKAAQEGLKEKPFSEGAKRGRDLFFGQKVNCTACHVGANFSDEKYHNLGVGMDKPEPDVGREAVTKDPKERGAFKTPTVRNVEHTAPYMHDGSQKTLEEVVEWYAKGGHPNPNLSDKIKKLDISDQDKKDLVEFMKALNGDFPKIETGRLPE